MKSIDEILFRCSSLGHIATEGNSITEIQLARIAELSAKTTVTQKQREELTSLILKRENKELPAGVKTHCVDVWVSATYNRFTEIHGKQLDKGNETEEDSITILSRKEKKLFKKNTETLRNKWIIGTPDLFEGTEINSAEVIHDTKSSWDAYSFFRAKFKKLNPDYYWQGTGYMALSGAKRCAIDYCLNNTPWHLVEGELRKESYRHPEGNTPAWIELQIINNHVYDKKTFDDYIAMRGIIPQESNDMAVIKGFVEIPLKERHFDFKFDRNNDHIQFIYTRVKQCREYIKENLL